MKKMTKNAAILAAMSIMIAGAAMASSAAEEGWNGNDNDGWTYVENGAKVKKAWKQVNGVWYYFKNDGTMAQSELVTISGKTYFLSETGALATGWQEMTDDMDLFDDIDNPISVSDDTKIDGADDYDDLVWMYFDDHGVAKENTWFQSPVSKLWYYFDGQAMVAGDAGYEIGDKVYGFQTDGSMFVGWNEIVFDKDDDRPNGEENKAWMYYGTNGQRTDDGWKKISGSWYYFDENSRMVDESVLNIDGKIFYVDSNGVMQTGGIVEIPKKTVVSGGTDAVSGSTNLLDSSNKLKDAIKVKLNSKGELITGKDGNNYLAKEIDINKNTSSILSAEKKSLGDQKEAKMVGQLTTEAFVKDDKKLRYYDDDGSVVKSTSMTFYDGSKKIKLAMDKDGEIAIADDYEEAMDAIENGEENVKIRVNSKSYVVKDTYEIGGVSVIVVK